MGKQNYTEWKLAEAKRGKMSVINAQHKVQLIKKRIRTKSQKTG